MVKPEWTPTKWVYVVSVVVIGAISVYTTVQVGAKYLLWKAWSERIADRLDGIVPVLTEVEQKSGSALLKRELQSALNQIQTLKSDLEQRNTGAATGNAGSDLENESIDVCPEVYSHDRMIGADAIFNLGFTLKDCWEAPEFVSLITLVYNFVHYTTEERSHIQQILSNVNGHYPGMKVVVALPVEELTLQHSTNFQLKYFNGSECCDTDIWNSLLEDVGTKYVYVGRNVIHFSPENDRLERLVREIFRQTADFVGSASRTFHGGLWSAGCHQTVGNGRTRIYQDGLTSSRNECIYCHEMDGPFAVKTETLKRFPLRAAMNDVAGFAAWFREMKVRSRVGIVCPDSMAFVIDRSRVSLMQEEKIMLAFSFYIDRLIKPDNKRLSEISGGQDRMYCQSLSYQKWNLPARCSRPLTKAVKMVMKLCQEQGMLCELEKTTLLGSVVFNHLLPWTLSAEFSVHPNNYTALPAKLRPLLNLYGYTLMSHDDKHYIFLTNSVITIRKNAYIATVGWYTPFDAPRITPTFLKFDGKYLRSPLNPGLVVRNRYGYGIYYKEQLKHVVDTESITIRQT